MTLTVSGSHLKAVGTQVRRLFWAAVCLRGFILSSMFKLVKEHFTSCVCGKVTHIFQFDSGLNIDDIY